MFVIKIFEFIISFLSDILTIIPSEFISNRKVKAININQNSSLLTGETMAITLKNPTPKNIYILKIIMVIDNKWYFTFYKEDSEYENSIIKKDQIKKYETNPYTDVNLDKNELNKINDAILTGNFHFIIIDPSKNYILNINKIISSNKKYRPKVKYKEITEHYTNLANNSIEKDTLKLISIFTRKIDNIVIQNNFKYFCRVINIKKNNIEGYIIINNNGLIVQGGEFLGFNFVNTLDQDNINKILNANISNKLRLNIEKL